MLPLQAHAMAQPELWAPFKSGYNRAKPDHKLPVHLPPVTAICAIVSIRPICIGSTS